MRDVYYSVVTGCVSKKSQTQPVLFQARSRSSTSATNLKRSAPNSKYDAVLFSITEYLGPYRSLTLPVCHCRVACVLCCTRRSGMRTRTRSSSQTSWSPCRSTASLIRMYVSVEVLLTLSAGWNVNSNCNAARYRFRTCREESCRGSRSLCV